MDMKIEVDLKNEALEKIENYIKQGNFKNKDDFIQQAVNLLLMAEEKKKYFSNILPVKKQED